MAPTPPADPLQTLIETWRDRAVSLRAIDPELKDTTALRIEACADELAAALALREDPPAPISASEGPTPAASKQIAAEMRPDWIEPYARAGNLIPVVIASTHPRFTVGTRLDWGFVSVALRDGYNVDLRQPALPMSSPDEGQG